MMKPILSLSFLLLSLFAATRAWAPPVLSIATGPPKRRSVAKFTNDAVPAEVLTAAIEAALLAPNHFLSEPTRFYQLCSIFGSTPTPGLRFSVKSHFLAKV